MVNRPAGGPRSTKYPRASHDWYCEHFNHVVPVFEAIDFGDDLIWDPACGRGNILDVAKSRGHPTIGSDIIDRHPRHKFVRGNFVEQIFKPPTYQDRALSIVTNPPYSYESDIAEKFIRKAVDMPIRRAAFILPIAFLCSATRFTFFARELKPSHVCIYARRPTMPPGEAIEMMGHKAFKGGMSDYIAIIYTAPHTWRTETIWLRPFDNIPES